MVRKLAVSTTTNKVLRLDIPFKAQATDTVLGEFSGLAAAWNIDLVKDRIRRGAFAATLAIAQARTKARNGSVLYPVLWMHLDKDGPIGGIVSAEEIDRGLAVQGFLDLSTKQGRRAFSGLSKGYISSLSIQFIPEKFHFEGDIRIIDELTLLEVSVVTFGANPEARVVDVKALGHDWLEAIVRDMEQVAWRLRAKKKETSKMTSDFNDAAFNGRNDRSHREPVPVPADFEDPAAFEQSLKKQLRDEDDLYLLHGKAFDNELALRKQQREKRQAEQQTFLEKERKERAERQRLMSAPTFTPKSFAQATGIEESWLRVRFQRWIAGGLIAPIDEKKLELPASGVKRQVQREHMEFEAKSIEAANRQGGRR